MTTARPMAPPQHPRNLTDTLFRIAIVAKGLDAVLQLAGALVLLVLPSTVILQVVHGLITRDLIGDPSGALAAHLRVAATQFADGNTRWFAIVYLALHGVVKLGLVVALWREILPAYPIAAVLLAAFVVYEVQRAAHTHSLLLPVFAAIDVVIIVLVIREYLRLRRLRQAREPAVGGT